MVKEPFLSCAITTSTDSSDDHKIHCFKPGQPCEAVRSLLETEPQKLLAASNAEPDQDPFASDTDEEETENNEILIEEEDEEGLASDESESDDSVSS